MRLAAARPEVAQPAFAAFVASLAAVMERPEALGRTLIFLGLAEGIAIYGLVMSILMLGKI
mgnify:CR=1 FL=1